MGIETLKTEVKDAMTARIEREGRAMHGTVRAGKFCMGDEQLEPVQAVELNLFNGKRVWAMRSRTEKAVLVGE